ncbi:hypothetical protein VTO42DRAFT_8170 [Malbranchea cinnamomea]
MAQPNSAELQLQQQPPSTSSDPELPASDSASAQLDLAITLILNSWPALTLAVQSSWGGPNSAEKRDWLCGAVADLFTSRPETDAEDLEEVLVQVMNDEFDVVVDDESAGEIADRICEVRQEIMKGEYGRVKALWEEWKAKGERKQREVFQRVDVQDEDQETDSDEEDDDVGEDSDMDVDMEDAPPVQPPQPRERIEPEVDEDGFTKVVGRRRR